MFKNIVPNKIKRIIKSILSIDESNPKTHLYKVDIQDIKKLDGMVVIVTGGTGAIGSAICYALATYGATVGMCGRNEDKIREIISTIRNESPEIAVKISPVVLDVNNDEQINISFKEFVNKYGRIDVLINNAGGQPGRVGTYSKHFFEQEISQIDLILNTNLRGTMMCSRIAAKYMVNQKVGTIINIASVIGMGGMSGMSDYAASKAGIIGFTKSLALELGKYNVRVNSISPGYVNQIPFDSGSEVKSTMKNPLQRHGFTREVAELVCFLISNSYITGQNFVIDGGRSIGLYGDN